MESLRKNRALHIDDEAYSALAMLKNELLLPATKLANKEKYTEVLKHSLIRGKTFPFPLILAPAGQRNKEVLSSVQENELLDLVCDDIKIGEITTEEVYKINKDERLHQVYGTSEFSHPGVHGTWQRLGSYAISGHYTLKNQDKKNIKYLVNDAKKRISATRTSALMMTANPLHRAHERLIRQAIEQTDLLVIFLLKPYNINGINYDVRYQALEYFITNFLPQNRVVIIRLEHSYIFAGFNELIIEAIVAKNSGCDTIIVGQDHEALGMYYDDNINKSILDKLIGIDIKVDIVSVYVYCDECKTLVSKDTCPHGQHHHISYNDDSILQLIGHGLIPPAVLVRKEISALMLSKLFPNRFKNLQDLYSNILPASGLLENYSEEEFYKELIKLYQTTSLT
ncbi:MAG: sulfate adenylyltransferase [Campylobacterota bacterium]|nr:sulfate adenylyltransferase [Campylobacterota bacterium]